MMDRTIDTYKRKRSNLLVAASFLGHILNVSLDVPKALRHCVFFLYNCSPFYDVDVETVRFCCKENTVTKFMLMQLHITYRDEKQIEKNNTKYNFKMIIPYVFK